MTDPNKSETYDPLQHSVVQAAYGTWEQFFCDDFVEALLEAILEEIKRVHWNVFQHQWGPTWHADKVEDPGIPGIEFVRYYDGCDCEDEGGTEAGHAVDCRHSKPNFKFEAVEFRWYKWPCRGMSTNVEYSSDEWRAWFNKCLKCVRALDGDHLLSKDRRRIEDLREEFYKRHGMENPVARDSDA